MNPAEEAAFTGGETVTGRQMRLYVLSSVLLALTVSLCLLVAVQVVTKGYASFFGRSVFRVVTGSMEPTIPVGAILLCEDTDIAAIREGDIICYRSREASRLDFIVTHRVMSVSVREDGALLLETRGDANMASDPYFVTAENLIGRVTWFTGKENVFTDILSFLSGKIGFMAVVAFPVLLIAGLVLQSVGKSIGAEVEAARRELREAPAPDSELLPGFQTITRQDYEQIYEAVRRSLLEELNNGAQNMD